MLLWTEYSSRLKVFLANLTCDFKAISTQTCLQENGLAGIVADLQNK